MISATKFFLEKEKSISEVSKAEAIRTKAFHFAPTARHVIEIGKYFVWKRKEIRVNCRHPKPFVATDHVRDLRCVLVIVIGSNFEASNLVPLASERKLASGNAKLDEDVR
jgi:hypothetical protein